MRVTKNQPEPKVHLPSQLPGTIISVCIIVVTVAVILVIKSHSGKQFNQDIAGRKVSIEWEEVNLRTGYSTSNEIITTLFKGSSITLTGNYYDCLIGNGSATDSWAEVELKDGTTGWVVTTSIKWN